MFLTFFRAYGWPGNLRSSTMFWSAPHILSDGATLHVEHFASLGPHLPQSTKTQEDNLDLDSAEKIHIAKVLRRVNGNIPQAAQLLGVSRATLYRKVAQHKISLGQAR